jgi:hypothetical protein
MGQQAGGIKATESSADNDYTGLLVVGHGIVLETLRFNRG